jgi:hypothetical protein
MSPFARIGSFFRHRAAGRCGYVPFILFFEKLEKVGNKRFLEEVAFEPSVDEVIDKMVRPEELQVLRHVRLADVEGLLEVAYAFDALRQVFQYPDASGMGDYFEQIKTLVNRDHNMASVEYMQTLLYFYAFVKVKF